MRLNKIMDIFRKSSNKILNFVDLCIGDIFEGVGDGCLYIKIDPIEKYNVLCLEDNKLYYEDTRTEVKRFNGALVEGYIQKED